MSYSIKSLTDPGSLEILEQNYEYDLLTPQKLLDKHVGKEVKLYTKNPHTEREEIAALLCCRTTVVPSSGSATISPSAIPAKSSFPTSLKT
jgi:hypothetical protein